MKDSMRAWCASQQLLQKGDNILCAVSGGADSMAMLWCLHCLRSELELTVTAAHFNHQLRGTEADRDESFVRQFCLEKGIALHVGRGDVSARCAQTGESTEEAARVLRYAFLQECAGSDYKIATAHTAQDNAETVLLHLLRGACLPGLCGIAPQRGNIIRPLLFSSRAQVEAFLSAERIPFVHDSTNDSDDYLRNRLRHHVMQPLLAENPKLAQNLLQTCQVLRAENQYLDDCAQSALQAAKREGSYCCVCLQQLPEVLCKRAIAQLLWQAGSKNPAGAHIEALYRLIHSRNPSAQVHLPGGLTGRREYDLFSLQRQKAAQVLQPRQLQVPGVTRLPEVQLKITCTILENPAKIINSPFTFQLKYDTIYDNLITVRPRQQGDMIHLRGGRRSLKKAMIDRKIPAAKRDTLPVFEDAGGILGVYAIGADCLRAAQPGERVLQLQIEKEDKQNDA